MALRPYQIDLDERRRASPARRIVIQSPTGSGKSVLIQQCLDAPRVLVLAHAEWLVDQLSGRMPESHQVIKAGAKYDGNKHVVGMVQTVVNRDDIPEPDVIVCDEAHNCLSPTYRRILDRYPNAIVYGFTATPTRLDGQGLGNIYDEMICGPQYQELIGGQYLNPFELYSVPTEIDLSQCRVRAGDYAREDIKQAVRKSTIFGDVVDHWRRLGRDGGHASFWPSIEAAEHAASLVPGWHALHSKMPRDHVRALIAGLRAGTVESLCTVDMIGEGLDVPGLASVSLCRPTKSLRVFMQQSGRCNRGFGGYSRVFDHVQNWAANGLPDDDRQWSLKGRIKRKGAVSSVPVWTCPECWAVNRSQASVCSQCSTDKPREIKIIEEREARLELISRAVERDIHEVCETPDQYLEFARIKGKRQTWAALKWAERSGPVDDNPFTRAAGHIRPTHDEFMRAADLMGLHLGQARVASKYMGLLR